MVHSRRKNIPKNFLTIGIVASIILIIIGVLIFIPNKKVFPKEISLSINNQGYYLEVAQTNKTRKKGLSQRNELCFNCGMLFVFNKSGKQAFWMKDTHIPLDIIWLDSKFQIVKIITAIKTDSEDIYINEKPAKYVIELNANESLKLGLKIGNTIQIPSP